MMMLEPKELRFKMMLEPERLRFMIMLELEPASFHDNAGAGAGFVS